MNPRSRGGSFRDIAAAIAAILVLDAALFHLGGYTPLLHPSSHAARAVEMAARVDAFRAERGARKLGIFMGDSVTGTGILEADVEQGVSSDGVVVVNAAHGGSSARAWYFLLRSYGLSPEDTAFVAVGLTPFSLRQALTPREDLALVKGRIGIADGLRLAATYPDAETRLSVVAGTFVRGILFRDDLRDFLRSPRERLASLRRYRASRRPPTERRSGHWGAAPVGGGPFEVMVPRRKRDVSQATVASPPLSIDPMLRSMLVELGSELASRRVPLVLYLASDGRGHLPPADISELEGLAAELRAAGTDLTLVDTRPIVEKLAAPRFYADARHYNGRGAELFSRDLGHMLHAALASRRTSAGSEIAALP